MMQNKLNLCGLCETEMVFLDSTLGPPVKVVKSNNLLNLIIYK